MAGVVPAERWRNPSAMRHSSARDQESYIYAETPRATPETLLRAPRRSEIVVKRLRAIQVSERATAGGEPNAKDC